MALDPTQPSTAEKTCAIPDCIFSDLIWTDKVYSYDERMPILKDKVSS